MVERTNRKPKSNVDFFLSAFLLAFLLRERQDSSVHAVSFSNVFIDLYLCRYLLFLFPIALHGFSFVRMHFIQVVETDHERARDGKRGVFNRKLIRE